MNEWMEGYQHHTFIEKLDLISLHYLYRVKVDLNRPTIFYRWL